MNAEELLEQVLRDRAESGVPQADPDLEALSIAVLLEDVFGVVLSDDDLRPDLLTDHARLRTLLNQIQEPS